MYLSKLSLKQKKSFLDACIKISNADGFVAKEEQALIEEFCSEMGIKSRKETELEFDAAIVELNAVSNKLQRKQILFELSRLAYADNVIKPREEQMLKYVMDIFKIPVSEYVKLIALVRDFSRVQKDINKFIAA